MEKESVYSKYWWLGLIVVLLLPLALYWLIKQPWGFDAIGGKDAPSDWLGFWGGYIGAVISASVAFFILDKQLKANNQVNKDNRDTQKKNIEYQQKMQWLNDFKKIAAEYTMVFNNNNLVVAQNNFKDNAKLSYDITRKILDQLQIAKTKMDLYNSKDEHAVELYSKLFVLYDKFSAVVLDIHYLSNYIICYNPSLDLHRLGFGFIMNPDNKFSEEIKTIIQNKDKPGIYINMIELVRERRMSVEKTLREVSDLLVAYTEAEQERINKILL